MTTLAQRFWSKVQVDDVDACWPWLAYRTPLGYGRFRNGERIVVAARMAYELTRGPIPDGLTIDHLCRNPPCVNPAHLEAVTMLENLARVPVEVRQDAGRKANPKGVRCAPKVEAELATHCGAGHEFTPDNTGVRRRKRGDKAADMRYCKACKRTYMADYKRQRRALGLPC